MRTKRGIRNLILLGSHCKYKLERLDSQQDDSNGDNDSDKCHDKRVLAGHTWVLMLDC